MKRNTLTGLLALTLMIFVVAACNMFKGSLSSPTATFKAFHEAVKNKDAAGMKRTLSKKTLEMIEEGAKEKGKSIDEALKETKDVPTSTPETRNEQINGDKATLEVKDKDKWETVKFVKEDGEWKLALLDDLADSMKDLKRGMENMNMNMNSNNSNSNSNSNSNMGNMNMP